MQPSKIVSQRWAAPGWVAGSAMLLVFLSVPAPAQQKPEQVAQQSAEAWLALTDSGTYGESWQQSASRFKAAVTQPQWEAAMRASREPLGRVVSRNLLKRRLHQVAARRARWGIRRHPIRDPFRA